MNTLFPKDPVDFLVSRKYPLGFLLPLDDKRNVDQEECKRRQEQVASYRAELKGKSEEQIKELYEVEDKKYQEELRLKLEKEEQQRFFNFPSADADFKLWGKAACWTLEEAIALCFGKNPTMVNHEAIKSFSSSPFVKMYGNLRFIVFRAKSAHQLQDPLTPGFFIAWAKRNKVDFPKELEDEVVANGQEVGDYKDRYDEILKLFERQAATHSESKKMYESALASSQQHTKKMEDTHKEYIGVLKERISVGDQHINRLKAEVQSLNDHLKACEQEIRNASSKQEVLHPKEKETLLKIIAAVCADAYGYNPSDKKNQSLADIRNALEKLGEPLDDDTIRDKLKKASVYLQPDYYRTDI